MGKVITCLQEKGGVGKSSAAANNSYYWAHHGKRVLIIDMDGQRANITHYLGVQKSEGMPTILNALQGSVDIHDAIVRVEDNFDIIPADVQVSGINESIKVSKMKKIIAELREEYDYISIDVTPTPNWVHFLAASVSDYLIVIQLPDAASLESTMGVAETVDEIREVSNPNLRVLGILINQNTNRTNLSKQSKQQAFKMAESLDTTVFNASIRNSVLIPESQYMHVGIDQYAPNSPVAGDVKALCEEIEERIAKLDAERNEK